MLRFDNGHSIAQFSIIADVEFPDKVFHGFPFCLCMFLGVLTLSNRRDDAWDTRRQKWQWASHYYSD